MNGRARTAGGPGREPVQPAQGRASSTKDADPGSAALLPTVARAAALFAAVVGLLVLAGWLLGIRFLVQVLPGQPAMAPNTAIALLFAALAVWLRASGDRVSTPRGSRLAAAAAGSIGLLTLAEYVSGRNLGIDELLFRDPASLTGVFPGRIAEVTAVSFVALAAALLLPDLRPARWITDWLALIPGFFAMISLAGYAYGVQSLHWIGARSGMAIHTALGLLALSLGVLLSSAGRGFARLIGSDTAGGVLARRVFPVALGVPLLLGWLRLAGQRAGLYQAELGSALDAVSNSVVLFVIFWGIAAALLRADQERQRAEDALAGSELRFRAVAAIVESSDDAIIGETLDGSITTWNVGAERLYGWPSSEAIGQPAGFHIPPDRRDEMRVILAKIRRGESIKHLETVRLRKNGDPIEVSLTVSPICGAAGEVAGASSIARDITESKRSQDSLRKAEEQYRLLFENSPHPMWVVDRETLRYLAVNDAAVEHYGYSRAEFLSMDVGQIRAAEDAAAVPEAIPKENAGLEQAGILRHRKKDGTLISVEIAAHALRFSGRSASLVLAYDVTDRLQAEKSVRESEHRYRSLFESMLHGYAYCEVIFEEGEPRDFVYLDVNTTFERMTGLTGVVGKRVTQVIPGIRESNPELFEIYGRVARTGAPERFEIFVDVMGIWFSISAYSPQKGRFVALFDNITERKLSEDALRESERRFSLAFHSSPIPTSISEVETGRLLDVNERFLEILGYSREEAIGKTSLDLGIWADRGDRDRAWASVRQDLPVRDEPTRIRTRSGEIRDVIGSAVTIELGSLKCVLWTFLDVTERRRAEKEMLKSEERFRILFDSNTIGIVIADLSGHTLEANDAFLGMVGFSREDLLAGKVNWGDLTPAEHRDRTRIAVEELQRTGIASPWEKEYFRKDGTRVPVLIGIAMLKATEGTCIGYIVDLTERRRLEQQFLQAQKMEAIGKLAGGVAHDFNNLLTVILGYSDLLAAKLDPGSLQAEELDEIRTAGKRAASLTRQLLAFSRQQVLERKVLDVNDLIADIEKMLRRLIGEDIELVTVLDPALRRVFADAGQLEQVIMNLAVNARDAMPRGGRLTIETANVELDETYTRLHATVQPGSYVMIAVSDSGVGMNSGTLAHMFEPFFTTKKRGEGTGLGLATVYGIVKQSGGSIWVYSEVGKGTTFKTYFPLVEEGGEAKPVPAAEIASLAGSETVLLVEDEESVRALSSSILKSYGYTVLEAKSGKDGLDVARRYPLPIHLLLTDVVMPEMGGSDLASRLEDLRPGVPVLYMSGYTDDAVFRQGFLEKGRVFLQKPFTPETLARKVREALGR